MRPGNVTKSNLRALGLRLIPGVATAAPRWAEWPPCASALAGAREETGLVTFDPIATGADAVVDYRAPDLADRITEHARGFQTRQRTRDPQTLDRELDAAREAGDEVETKRIENAIDNYQTHISKEQQLAASEMSLNEGNTYLQNLLLAKNDIPEVSELSLNAEWKLVQAIKQTH